MTLIVLYCYSTGTISESGSATRIHYDDASLCGGPDNRGCPAVSVCTLGGRRKYSRRKGKADTGHSAVIKNVSGGNRHGKIAVLYQYGCFTGVVTSVPILAVTSMYGGMQLSVLYQSAAYVGFFILFAGSIGVFCSCRFQERQLMPPYRPMACSLR